MWQYGVPAKRTEAGMQPFLVGQQRTSPISSDDFIPHLVIRYYVDNCRLPRTEERKREINHTASDEDATLDWGLYNYFSSYEVYNDYGAIKRTRGSCFFPHLFFVGICAKSSCLKTQESQGMYVRSGCQVVQSQGDLIFEPILLPLAFSTYFAAQISRCTGSTWNFVFH